MLIDLFDDEKENPEDYISFIVFEPASLRIPDNDLLLIGDQVTHLFDTVMTSNKFENNIQDQILINRLQRIEMMLDLLKSNNGLILTKFLSKIWRRYSFFSNLGELFISQKDLTRLAPNYEFKENIILDRVVEAEDAIEESDDDDDDKNSGNDDDKDGEKNDESSKENQ